jgi:hypothetical protein
MLKFTEIVPASQIWPSAENHIDIGEVPGFMRGYNIEVKKNDVVDWMSAEWIYGNPEEVFDDEYHRFSRADWGLIPTGRISFRGYGVEKWDPIERDTYVSICADADVNEIAQRYQPSLTAKKGEFNED